MDQNGDFTKKLKSELEKCVSRLDEEFKVMQVGRANPKILDKVKVDYYGTMSPVSQVGSISVKEGRVLVVSPWDANLLKPIEQAIQKANLGINPTNDGRVIRLVFPQLTGERRSEIVKEIGAIAERYRIQIRNIRKRVLDEIKNLNKSGEISDDEEVSNKKNVQNIVDDFMNKVKFISEAKEDEVSNI